MTFSFSGVFFQRRTMACWATATVAVALLTGCSSGAGGQFTSLTPTLEAAPATGLGQTPALEAIAPSPAGAALAGLRVAPAGAMADYDRDAQFGDWIDADGDCQDTRQEVLARDLREVVSTDGCRVDSGILDDPYTATTIDFTRGVATSADVQIDHVVAAGNAWISGARQLSQTQRVAFYNDPLNLLAVDGPTNGAKSDAAAHQWLPPNTEVHCEYVATQIAVKTKYQLWVTSPEKTAMATVLTDCAGQPLPTGQPFTTLPAPSSPSASPAPAPAPAAPTTAVPPPRTTRTASAPKRTETTSDAPYYANCDAARAAGAAPVQRGEPGYRSALDRDNDGTACDS